MGDEHELFAEWCKQTFEVVRQTQKDLTEIRKGCETCRLEQAAKLAELDKRVSVAAAKVGVAVLILVGAVEVVLKIWR